MVENKSVALEGGVGDDEAWHHVALGGTVARRARALSLEVGLFRM